MRALLAGLFVMGGMLAVVAVSAPWIEGAPLWRLLLFAVGMVVLFFILLFAALIFFNSIGRRLPARQGETLEELEAKGLLTRQHFQARRAFQVEEFEDEGSHYLVELHDGSVLYLNGQLLYEYEPITDDPELNQPRSFPCTEFTVVRDKRHGEAVDIVCRGEVLEPECVAPFFKGPMPEDGQIFTDRSYDELKQDLTGDANS